MSNNPIFQIQSVKPAPPNANYYGKVTFIFQVSRLDQLAITHSVERNDGWRNYTDVEICGDAIVRVRSGFLRISKNGEMYVQVPNFKIPWNISNQVAQAAAEMLPSQNGGEA